jgi:Rrf2 family protein
MIDLPQNKSIGIKKIAEMHNLAPAYLSKIFSKLRQSGIVKSTPGTNGGYQLAKSADEISFWDIIESIEGSSYFFQCGEIREKNIFENDSTVFKKECPCLIKTVMFEAEEIYRNSLKNKSLLWLHGKVKCNFSTNTDKAIKNWIEAI